LFLYFKLTWTFTDSKGARIFTSEVFHQEKDHQRKGGARDLGRPTRGPATRPNLLVAAAAQKPKIPTKAAALWLHKIKLKTHIALFFAPLALATRTTTTTLTTATLISSTTSTATEEFQSIAFASSLACTPLPL
jgi:hypothetical protein